MMRGKNSKSVGADLVPQEMLKDIVSTSEGLTLLTGFYNRVFQSRSLPSQWSQSLMTLLAKISKPQGGKDLRPLMVTSHVCKTYSRILVTRLMGHLSPNGPEQCCAGGRQTADMLFALQNTMQVAAEWGQSLAVLKIDLSKAFDCVRRPSLASTLAEEIGPHQPWEVAALIGLLKEGVTKVDTLWGSKTTSASNKAQ